MDPWIAGLIAGAIAGLFPLVFGLTRNEGTLAAGGFVACLASGVVLGLLLAAPVAILFMVVIYMQSREHGHGTPSAA